MAPLSAPPAAANISLTPVQSEFDRQVTTLVQQGFPTLTGLASEGFVRQLQPLSDCLGSVKKTTAAGRIPFVIVVKEDALADGKVMPMVEPEDMPGKNVISANDVTRFKPIEGVQLPTGAAYLLLDVDTGADFLNVTPDDALKTISRRRRSPLTLDEGIAVVIQFPDILKTRNAFSLLASRRGDQRVPALWISKRQPKLGWCWAGNPHTWLGSASCGGRVGV